MAEALKKPTTFKDFAELGAELERAGSYRLAESAWRKAGIAAFKDKNAEWATHRAAFCERMYKRPFRGE